MLPSPAALRHPLLRFKYSLVPKGEGLDHLSLSGRGDGGEGSVMRLRNFQ